MKNQKSSRGPLLLLFLITLISSCGDEKQKPTNENQPFVEAPKQIIEAAEAKKLFNNYENRRVPLIQHYEDSINADGNKFDVARFVSYDIETMKQYISFVEQEAAEANTKVKSLRIYFANYPDITGFKHPRQNSVMILPTTEFKGIESGFYTTGDGEGGRKAVTIRSLFSKNSDKIDIRLSTHPKPKSEASFTSLFFTLTSPFQGKQSLIMNRGTGTPPPNNRSDF